MSQGKDVSKLTGVQRLLEGSLILCCMIATFVLIALASYSPMDSGWSQSSYQGKVDNLGGTVGAWVADVLLYFFGYVAFFIPMMIAAFGWLLFKRAYRLIEIDYFTVALRLIGFFLALLSIGALSSMNAEDVYQFSAGGLAGNVIGHIMVSYFSHLGSTLLLLCFLIAGFTLFTGISIITIVDSIGHGTITFSKFLYSLPSKFKRREQSEDANGFMSIVAKVRQRRENSESSTQEEFYTEQKIEPNLDTPFGNNHSEEVLDELGDSFTALVEGNDEVLEKTKTELVPKSDKAQVVDGIIVLPGQEEIISRKDMPPLPSITLLDVPNRKKNPISQEELDQVARLVEIKLADFNITAKVVSVSPGPVITRFELELAPGIKASKITNLSKDLARSLLSESVRVVEVIPGKPYVGIELPNKFRETVFMRDVLDSEIFEDSASNLSMVLGQDISGVPVVVDLGKMPHLLVAGTTGSGKSVGVNVMITSLLYKSSPDDVRFIMIDPKMLELSVYEGIPHLLCDVVTDMKEAANALRWCVGEMERRYKLMSALGVRNLKGYNSKIALAKEQGEPIKDPLWKPNDGLEEYAPDLEKLPSIVVIVDEFADMIMIVGKKVEELIARIAQKARAAGIHLILATQRPSVDVITGLIKANVPTRIAFQVSSRIDSRTILDQQGAETLLGMGDMLYLPPGTSVPIRVHGAFIDDHEVHKVVGDWKARGKPQYIDDILNGSSEGGEVLLPGESSESEEDIDALYDEAVAFVTETRRGSISSVQRKFKIGYNRAARIIESMETQGVVSSPGNNGNREVLAPPPPKNDY
ncbi:DNA translocase FtsK [Parashewanella spongiae]|uniref:DNA translocase FtsK n=1 Tax=Parashewanella spongiae TaxID=342950 RepID=A0A3A6UH64_9GAMM|nr:DNA translocase FtsK [Parashewanella spongiae]MCL1077365.1 DNA translocase FtsK 4TM domain-containing protein [Parashewanella spongiae]RJY18332.1 DNA translocase FtsK [Parashewanella spongiae]